MFCVILLFTLALSVSSWIPMMLIVTSSPDCTKRYCASTTPMLSSFVPLYSPMHTIPFTAVPFTTIPFTTIPATIHALYTHLSVYLRGHGAHLRRKRAMASRLLSFTRSQSGARLRLFCLLITSAMVRLCVLRSARWSIVDNLIRQVGLFLSIYIYSLDLRRVILCSTASRKPRCYCA